MSTDKNKKLKEKLDLYSQDKDVATFVQTAEMSSALLAIAEKLQQSVITAKGDQGEKGEDGYTPVKGKDYFDGEDGYTPVKGKDYFDGKDYKLTATDKKEIAGSIKVPIVKKIVEKIEVIKEQPIITEVAKYETAEDIVAKINTLTEAVNIETIKGHKKLLEKTVSTAFKRGGGLTGINTSKITVSSTQPSYPQINDLWYDIS